jgi:hypothetical protein
MLTRRGSRADTASNGASPRVKCSVFPTETQRPAAELPPLKLHGTESASEHIRNALQVLLSVERDPLWDGIGITLFDTRDVDAITGRLRQALELLDKRTDGGMDWQWRAGLDDLEIAHPEPLRCIHCGCTDAAACLIDPAVLAPSDLAVITAYFAEVGEEVPDPVNCWWISQDPPVCSNPVCAERARAAGIAP